MRGVRGDRHGRVPARRLVGHVAVDVAPTRRPTSSACCSSATRCSPRSTGCTRGSRCASPTSRSASRKAASAGSPACSTGSTTCCSYHAMYGTWSGVDAHAGRGAAAQLLVLRGRRPVGVRACATASASTTSCSSPTTRTPTRPGPTPRRVIEREIGGLPARRHPQDHVAERVAALPAPGAPDVQADPDAF